MSTGKMKIKIGAIEIEYEGSESFLKQDLPELILAVAKLHESSGQSGNSAAVEGATNGGVRAALNALSVTSVAAKLGAKSGSDLVLAAGARLSRGGSLTFARSALLTEMKLANGFYKTTYSSNFSNYLLTLVKEGKLQETAKDVYSLSMAAKTEIEAKLA
jgi:hypothetical protein